MAIDHPKSIPHFELSGPIYTLLLAILAFVVLCPIGFLLVSSLVMSVPGHEIVYGLAAWHAAWREPGITEAILNTLRVTAVVQAISIPLALVIGWVIARTDMPGANLAEFLFWISYFIPTLAITQGWILVFDPNYGLANQLLSRLTFSNYAPFNIYSFWGIVFTHLTALGLSIKIILLVPAFRNMDASLEEASLISGAGTITTLFRIVVPAIAPAVAVTVLMSLIRSFEAFEIELVLGTPFRFSVFSTKIYGLITQEPVNYAGATALSLFILMTMLPLVVMQLWISRRGSYVTLTGRYNPSRAFLGKWRWVVCAFVFSAALFCTLIPVSFLLMGSFMNLFGYFDLKEVWSLRHWETVLTEPKFLRSVLNTLALCSGTAAAAVTIYGLIAYITVRTRFCLRWGFDALTWLPFTLPGIVLGLGYFLMVLYIPGFSLIYGSRLVTIMVLFITSMTFSVQIFKSNLLQLSTELEDASRAAGASWWCTMRRITVPLMIHATVLVGVMTFASAARQVSAIVLLTTSETEPLSVLQLGYLVGENPAASSVVGTVILALTSMAALVARRLGLRMGIHNA